jgi:predicted glycoside hydrolase/deacetylase ChbG (UPF0249 family)
MPRSNAMKIILNCDDFGLNEIVNQRILELISLRRVTSATLIGNAPSIENAARNIPNLSQCSFGVHLNLTQFRPLTPQKDLGSLSACLDENGEFSGEDSLRTQKIDSSLREALFNELRLQVERILSLGVKVSHFDSHHHIHTIPELFFIFKRLQKHFGIRKVRTTFNIYEPRSSVPWARLCKKKVWEFSLRHYYPTVTTSKFTSFNTFYHLAKSRVLQYESVELMVHPGQHECKQETRLLYSDWQKEMRVPTELISYWEL